MSAATGRDTIQLSSWQPRGTSARPAPGTRVTTPINMLPRRLAASSASARPISPLASPRYQRSRSGSTSSVDEIPPSVALLVLRRKFAHAIATRMKLDQTNRQSPERSVSRASVGTETDTEIDELLKDYEVTISPRGERKSTDKNSLVINKRTPVVEEIIQKSDATDGLQAEIPSDSYFDTLGDSKSSQQTARKRALPLLTSSLRQSRDGVLQNRSRETLSGRQTPDSGLGSLNKSIDSQGRSPRRDQGGEEKLIRAGTDLAQTQLNLLQTGQDLRALRLRIVMLRNEVGNVRDEREKMDSQLKNMMKESSLNSAFSRRTLKFRLQ